jgi:toxin ParE1/3/4
VEEALVKQLRFHEEAAAELDAAIGWYNARRDGLGLALHGDVQAALDCIAANSKCGSKYRSQGYRFLSTKRFPYVVYWLELDDTIWVAAVAHARRHPNFWQHRHPDD